MNIVKQGNVIREINFLSKDKKELLEYEFDRQLQLTANSVRL